MDTDQSYCFIFVCQAGRLEVDALMLALSLQHFVKCKYELVAAIPTPASLWGTPQALILEQLERMNVRVVEIVNQVDPDYPIGNKISCLSIPTEMDKLVFIDSDVLCMGEFDGGDEFRAPFNAKLVDVLVFGKDPKEWEAAYSAVGLPLPDTVGESTVGGEATLPYYNAGLVAVPSHVNFGQVWLEMCLAIDANPAVVNKRPWLDQIALPLAVQKLGLEVGQLTERHNFPLHLRRVDEEEPPVFCHYHSPKQLLTSPSAIAVIRRIASEHPYVWDLMSQQPEWRSVAKLHRAKFGERLSNAPGLWHALQVRDRVGEGYHQWRTHQAERGRNAIVTGFPRSGTSLYSTLLNSIPNVVCLNEISPTVHTFSFYRKTRSRIAAGQPVPNKYSGSGALTTNTIGGGTQTQDRIISIDTDQFVLAQKFTLPYLNRLQELCDQGWSVWVLVRHPLYAISSWKRCPAHFGISKIDPPGAELAHIEFSANDPDERRVEIWNHYARAIHGLRDRLHIVRYEDLVEDPQSALHNFCGQFELQVPGVSPELESRNRSGSYRASDELRELVNERCELELFGYERVLAPA